MKRSPVSDSYFIFHKAATTVAYVAMLILTIRFFRGRLDWQFAAGCTVLSGAWLLLTKLKMAHFLQTYFDVFSRLEVVLPCALGVGLSATSFIAHPLIITRVADCLELVFWIVLYHLYSTNKQKYVQQGHGPLPKGTWINPPVDLMSAGDLILTNGNVAKRLHETVGHAATVIKRADGLYALSSHMDRGCTLDPIHDVLAEVQGHYIALKLAEPIDHQKEEQLATIASQLVKANVEWKGARNKWWQQFIERLPLDAAAKAKIGKLYYCTGYDWFGTFMGRIERNRWTCIGAALALYHRAGIHTNPYGTGLLGFGTTLFDPIMPVRFLNDPAFRLITTGDHAKDEQQEVQLFNDPFSITTSYPAVPSQE